MQGCFVGVVKDHPDGTFTQLGAYVVRRDIGSILSQKEPSEKPGPIQS